MDQEKFTFLAPTANNKIHLVLLFTMATRMPRAKIFNQESLFLKHVFPPIVYFCIFFKIRRYK